MTNRPNPQSSDPGEGENQPATPIDVHDPRIVASIDRYWRTNVALMVVLLVIWAVVGLGCGVLFADVLNEYKLPGTGFPLGFWFAQQGSIIVFVLIILVYAVILNRLDKKHRRELEQLRNHPQPQDEEAAQR